MHEKGFNFAPVPSALAGRQVPQVCPAGTSLQTMLWKSDGEKTPPLLKGIPLFLCPKHAAVL